MVAMRRLGKKEARNLRHWAMELVVVVVGVLIALGLQQWAERRARLAELASAEEAIHREVLANLVFLVGRESISQCLSDRAHLVHNGMGQGDDRWPGIKGSAVITDFEKVGPDTIGGIYNVQGEEPSTNAWDSALASGVLRAMDRERFDKLVAIYADINKLRSSLADEQLAIRTLSSLANPIHLTPEIRNQMHQAVWQVEQARWIFSQYAGPEYFAGRMEELGWNDFAEIEKYREQSEKDTKVVGVTLRPCVKPMANPFSRPAGNDR